MWTIPPLPQVPSRHSAYLINQTHGFCLFALLYKGTNSVAIVDLSQLVPDAVQFVSTAIYPLRHKTELRKFLNQV